MTVLPSDGCSAARCSGVLAVKLYFVRHARFLFAAPLIAGSLVVLTGVSSGLPGGVLYAAEEWPFKERPGWGQEWPFNENAEKGAAGSQPGNHPVETDVETTGSVTVPVAPETDIVPVQRGPISILPPRAETEEVSPLQGSDPQEVILYPSGPGVDDQSQLPTRALNARPGEVGTGVEVGSLSAVDEASVGLLDDRTGGLGPRMWDGTDRRFVELNLGKVVSPAPSPAMADLSRRLLLTAARPPQGTTEDVSLLAVRLNKLNEAGHADEIAQLLARAGGVRPSPAAALEYAMAALAVNEHVRACNLLTALPVGEDVATDPVAAFATKLSIYCQIVAGETLAANLGADLAREQGLDDGYFLALAAAATDGLTLKAEPPQIIDPLTFRMIELAKWALPEDAMERLHPSLLPVLARATDIAPETRIAIAERAALLGLINGDEMASAYLGVAYTRDEVVGVRAGIEPASPYRRRALFHQAVLDEPVPTGLADLLSALFMREAGGAAYRATLGAHQSSLASVPPSGALTAFAPFAARAFIDLGDRVRAGMWLSVLDEQNAQPRVAREIRALLRLIDPSAINVSAQTGPDVIAPYLQDALNDLPAPGAAHDFAAVEVVLLEALGASIPQSVYDAILASGGLPDGAVPAPAVMRRLEEASLAGRVGEAVLVSLIALGDAGPQQLHALAMADIVSALSRVGLQADARRLAVEALSSRITQER